MPKKNSRAGRSGKWTISRAVFVVGSVILSIVTSVTAFAMVSYSSYVIYDSVYTNRAAFSSWDLSQYRPKMDETGKLTFEDLLEINPDTVAWLKIDGTNIDYPVVQGKDDLEYASKDIFGNNSLSGSIYLTTANTRDFTNSFNLIYGHHMDNGAMFGDIEKYKDYDYFHNHRKGILITTRGNYDLDIFARVGTDAYDSKIYSAGDRKYSDFPYFLEYVQSIAIQWQEGTDIYKLTDHVRTYLKAREENIAENGRFVWEKMPQYAIDDGLQLLAMSTCADATTNGRQILFATMKIRSEPLPEEMYIEDAPVPLAAVGHGQEAYWGLINLLCVIFCVIVFLPGLASIDKYGRIRLMKRANREQERMETTIWRPGRFRIRLAAGTLIEAGLSAFALIWFITSEDLYRRMTVIDRWTPLMLVLALGVLLTDILLIRYRER